MKSVRLRISATLWILLSVWVPGIANAGPGTQYEMVCEGTLSDEMLSASLVGGERVELAPHRGGPGMTVIDVMVVYTTSFRQALGGTSNALSHINLRINNTNTVFSNSQVNTSFRLVHTQELIGYSEVGVSVDLDRLAATNDGFMDGVHALRDAQGADLVMLMQNAPDPSIGGRATVLRSLEVTPEVSDAGFTVLYRLTILNTLAHEFGHNFGLHHNPPDDPPGVFPYSFGHRWTGLDTVVYTTLMYNSAGTTEISQFSNPNLSFAGVPTGVPDQADAARSLNETAFLVSSYRDILDDLELTPRGEVSVVAFVNDPVPLEQKEFTLRNSGISSINWTTNAAPAWVDLSPTSGTLAAGASIAIQMGLNSNANGFPIGLQSHIVTITNQTSGTQLERRVRFEVFDDTPIVVTSLLDTVENDGVLTFREALIDANATRGPVHIDFSVAGTLLLTQALPPLSDKTGGALINGNGNVVIDGALLSGGEHGLDVQSADNVIEGLSIVRFPGHGILIRFSSASGNIIRGCLVGTDGTNDLGNAGDGILIVGKARNNLIGGPAISDRNIVSGNGFAGVAIGFEGADDNIIIGNYIGTNAAGSAAIPNGSAGVVIFAGANTNQIGGALPGEGNLLSGNNDGVLLVNSGTDANVIQGNRIGLNAVGDSTIPNTYSGVAFIGGPSDNLVGGMGAGEGNRIAGNGTYGVYVADAGTLRNEISANAIFMNAAKGIILLNGGNSGLVGPSPSQLSPIAGTTLANSRVEFFVDSADEGETFIGSSIASGAGAYSATIPLFDHVGLQLTATTTDPSGNTSEFGTPVLIDAASLLAPVVWVDFDYTGVEFGTEPSPFDTLLEGNTFVTVGGTIRIMAGSTTETIVLDRAVRVEAVGGTVRLGGL